MNKETYCDQCGKSFRIKLKTKTHNVVIKESYFVCPGCKKKYTAFVTDAECRKLQRDIRALRKSKEIPAQQFVEEKITEEQYKDAIDLIRLDIDKTQQLLNYKMNKLKEALT